VSVWGDEDVGVSEPGGHRGGPVHGGAVDARQRLARRHPWPKVRTTVADPAATRAPDVVNRQFHAAEPGVLHVADFTYVPLAGGGFGYTAFVIDAYAGLIPGWECSTSKHTDFVEAAIRQAVPYRRRQGHPLGAGAIHHSDAGSQYTAVHFGQTLFLEGLTPSIGSVGDAYDNALAETTIGLYKTECVRAGSPFRRGPIRTLADLEQITSLVQHPTAHASPRPRSTGRSRSRLPRCNRRRHPGGITHKLRGVRTPGWLKASKPRGVVEVPVSTPRPQWSQGQAQACPCY
jgi:transposase InsO family protein